MTFCLQKMALFILYLDLAPISDGFLHNKLPKNETYVVKI